MSGEKKFYYISSQKRQKQKAKDKKFADNID